MSDASYEPGFYEARELGGGLVSLYQKHSSLEEAQASSMLHKNEGLVRHMVVQILPTKALVEKDLSDPPESANTLEGRAVSPQRFAFERYIELAKEDLRLSERIASLEKRVLNLEKNLDD